MFGDAILEYFGTRRRLVPAAFQLVNYQSIFRVDGIVLLAGTVGQITGRFEVTFERFRSLEIVLYLNCGS